VGNILGISFSSDKIRFTELTGDNASAKLENLETVSVDFDFEDEIAGYKSNQKVLTNISNEISSYINRRKQTFLKTGVAISTSQAFMMTLPVDYSEGTESINTKIYWELSNYFPDNYNEFIINTYKLNRFMPSSKCDEFLIIAVLKNTTEFIKRIFKICGIELAIIDIDHFASENTLRFNYPANIETSGIMLIGLKKGRVDYGYIKNKKYTHYAYSKYYSEVEFNLNLVKKLNSLLDSGIVDDKLKEIFIYGEELKPDTVEILKKNHDLCVTPINPFESINAQTVFLKNEELRKEAYRYSSSCGVALRCLQKVNS
jgi:Tfp pilus assembly PilM family ATPase